MKVGIIRATPEGLETAAEVADAMGLPFNPSYAEANAHRVLTLYFEDIARANAPRFDHIRMAEFTRRRINAYADASDPLYPHIHIDQRFDSWLLGMTLLWAVRAFNELGEENRAGVNKLLVRMLDVKTRPSEHEEVRDDMKQVFTQYGDALRVAHELSVAGCVFVACHELAHHELDHLSLGQSYEIELEADLRGYELMRRVYTGDTALVTLHRQPYAMAGSWAVLTLFDLWERRQAMLSGLTRIPVNPTHPASAVRLARLRPLLAREPARQVEAFITGFGDAMHEIADELGLSGITPSVGV